MYERAGPAVEAEILTRTQEDLLAFHAWAFGGLSQDSGPDLPEGQRDDDDDDDGLGYYADGVKRTLTDEQIAIFRHSEIHSLLRAREQAAGHAARAEAAPHGTGVAHEDGGRQGAMIYPKTAEGEDGGFGGEDGDEEAEYAEFLRAERREFERAAKRRKIKKSRKAANANDRTISTRRRVREMDEPDGEEHMLDYGKERPGVKK
jgi:hypothetical protein